MALSAPRVVYGIHSATFYNPKTGLPYGTARVLGNGTFTMEGETIELRGGSNRFPWSIQDGNVNASIEIGLKEYPDFLMELFLGKKPSNTLADANGQVVGVANKFGSSIISVSNGISTIAPLAGSEANLKFTKYVLKAVASDEVDLYAMSNIDFNRGTDADFQDDLLKVNSAPIAIVAGANNLASFGLVFTGVGTPNFTIDETATFEVLPIHAGAMDVVVGGLSDIFPEFGVVLMTQQLGSGEMFEIDVFKAKAIGMNLGAQEKAFSETPVSAKAYFDADKGGICKIRAIKV
jgi:hypothetical protein